MRYSPRDGQLPLPAKDEAIVQDISLTDSSGKASTAVRNAWNAGG